MGWRELVLILALCSACQPGFARGPKRPFGQQRQASRAGRTPIDEFERMSPEQQQRALDRLTPGQRRKLQERIDRFDRLSQPQQRTLRNLYNRLHQLPPERQDAVRKAINRFSRQPPERQNAIRQELRGMEALSEQGREARMASRDFKNRFSAKEQGIVRDMAPLLPPN